jgi:hypothetical protein
MKHGGQNVSPYGEAQATAWLAWLARGMQAHGQTIFLIEQLQPSWLSACTQRRVYILTEAMIAGLSPVDERSWKAGLLGSNKAGLYHPPRRGPSSR